MRILRHASSLVLLAGLAACHKSDPSGPVVGAQQLALDGRIAVHATVQVPDGRGPRDTLHFLVTLRNTSGQAREVAVGSSTCIVFVRLLAAAPGLGASATFYDDYQRPCTRDLRHVRLAPGASETFRHAVPASRIPDGAPEDLQAHVSMRLDAENVMLVIPSFHLPRSR